MCSVFALGLPDTCIHAQIALRISVVCRFFCIEENSDISVCVFVCCVLLSVQ